MEKKYHFFTFHTNSVVNTVSLHSGGEEHLLIHFLEYSTLVQCSDTYSLLFPLYIPFTEENVLFTILHAFHSFSDFAKYGRTNK